jgi:hypothetical protein
MSCGSQPRLNSRSHETWTPYRDRQIVDLSAEPRTTTIALEDQDGRKATIHFSAAALYQVKSRLDQLGISPNTFSRRPEKLETASPYPGLNGFEESDAGLFIGRGGDIARGLAENGAHRMLPICLSFSKVYV